MFFFSLQIIKKNETPTKTTSSHVSQTRYYYYKHEFSAITSELICDLCKFQAYYEYKTVIKIQMCINLNKISE